MDLASKKPVYFTSKIPWDVDGFNLSDDGSKIAFTTNEAGASKLYSMNTTTKEFKEVRTFRLVFIVVLSFIKTIGTWLFRLMLHNHPQMFMF